MLGKKIGECRTCAALRDEILFLRTISQRLLHMLGGVDVAEVEAERKAIIAGHVEQAISDEEGSGDAAVYGDD